MDLAEAATCAQLLGDLPSVDILVNNAALLADRPLEVHFENETSPAFVLFCTPDAA